ncbi:unnamed protein product [Urochloa humidicola]
MATSQHGLDSELLRALTSGDEARVEELLTGQGDGRHSRTGGRLTISVQLGTATAGAAAPPRQLVEPSVLVSVMSTALHMVAGGGHAGFARRVCELAPSLLATRDGCLDTPLHRAAKAGHQEVAACLLPAISAAGADAAAALLARNRLGATALYEAVRNGHAETPKGQAAGRQRPCMLRVGTCACLAAWHRANSRRHYARAVFTHRAGTPWIFERLTSSRRKEGEAGNQLLRCGGSPA